MQRFKLVIARLDCAIMGHPERDSRFSACSSARAENICRLHGPGEETFGPVVRAVHEIP